MIWVWVAGLVLAIAFVGLGFAAFGGPRRDDTPMPSWMTKDVDTGERPYVGHRRRRKYKEEVGVEGTGDVPLPPPVEDLGAPPPVHPRVLRLHSREDAQERTQRIPPLNPPPPDWPPRRPL